MTNQTSSAPVQESPTQIQRPKRLLSIDLLRGLTIGFMILVNDNGSDGAYWPLKHAAWNGFTPTDLVFPTFLFLVGVSTVLSTAKRLAARESRQSLFLHVLRRSVILFLLGMVVNSFPFFHLATMRFYGVLPRIALCYLIVATFYIFFPGWRSKVAALVAALVGYWILMRFVPVPGFGVPTHEIPLLDRDANLTAWLDRQIFSSAHLYERTRDPEGLLSTIPALGTTLMGLLTGLWLQTSRSLAAKTRWIGIAGATSVALGVLWNLSFPINKKLWTSSYVLLAGGLSLLLLTFFLYVSDLRSAGKPDPASTKPPKRHFAFVALLVFGTNAIFAYVLSEVLATTLGIFELEGGENLQQGIYRACHRLIPDVAFASLIYSLGYVSICWLIVYLLLYRRRVFIKI
jgi:predicted acyltransferase